MEFNRKEYLAEYYQKNKTKIDARNRLWQQANKNKVYQYDVKRIYGLTAEELSKLPPFCEICGTSKNLCIDHCHTKRKVRGRLCKSCNSAIGFMKEDKGLLYSAIAYLEKYCGV